MGSDLFDRYESNVRSYCRAFPAVFSRAAGPYLWDTEGQRYTDLLCGAGALNYGHNDPLIHAAVRDYLDAGGPIQSLDLHTQAKATFIERFVEVVLEPRGMDHVLQFPGPAGTLAVEAALKLARKLTGRTNVVAFTGAFHGASLGALALSSAPTMRAAAGVPLGPATILPYDTGRAATSADVLADLLRPGSGIDPPAAVVLETVQGEGGLAAASPAWLRRVAALARETGALLVVDDIQAGCGRTGGFFSFDGMGIDPDLVCLSKSLSGLGLPMAMLLIRREFDRWRPGEHNGTFRGHNLAFVGATAALDYWRDPAFAARTGALATEVRRGLAMVAAAAPSGEISVAGRGLMSGLRFRSGGAMARRVRDQAYAAGVIAETSGPGDVLKIFPPLTMPVADWRAARDVLLGAVVETFTFLEAAA